MFIMMEKVEMMHRTNPVNFAAYKRGNAAGFHGKDQKRVNRRETRQQELRANRGDYDAD